MIPPFKAPSIDVLGWVVDASGLLAAAGIVVGRIVGLARADQRRIDREPLDRALPWLIVGGLVGGRAAGVVLYGGDVAGPMSSVGVLVGGGIAAWWTLRRAERPGAAADCLAVGAAIGWTVARLGGFLVHDEPGVASAFPLAVLGACHGGASDVACHDLGLYETLLALVLTGTLAAVDVGAPRDGTLATVLAVGYAAGRFGLDFLRDATEPRFMGLTWGQHGAIVLGVLAWRLWVAMADERREAARTEG